MPEDAIVTYGAQQSRTSRVQNAEIRSMIESADATTPYPELPSASIVRAGDVPDQ